jgi:phosphatidylglycerol:prolipoprotein diacylglycerol transferase
MNTLSAFVWNVSPELVNMSLGPLHIRLAWYGLLFVSGFVVAYNIMQRIFRKEGKPIEDVDTLTLYMIAGTVIGMRLGHVLFYDPAYYAENLLEVLQIWKGGYASHGAVIGISTAIWLYSRSRPKQPFLWMADRIALVSTFAGVCIRIGNFFNQEMIGNPTDVPWAIIFPLRDMIPRHPAQLYEALCYAVTFGILLFVYHKYGERTPRGRLLGIFFIMVFGARFVVEFLKKNQVSFEDALLLNMGQMLSIPLIILGIFFLIRSFQAEQPIV